jgi:hypothetical protein
MLNHYDLGLYVGWFEVPRDFIGLPELYGLKCENLITSVIVFITSELYGLRRFSLDKKEAIKKEITKLMVAGFIREILHPDWLANPVLV